VNARKGLGKSALLCHVHYFKKGNPNYLSIHLTAKDFYFNENDLKNGQTNNFEHLWQEKICDRIISEIGKEIKFAYTINDITIVKHSEDKGFKQQNPVGFLIGHVKFFGKFFRINLKPQKQVNTIQLVKQYLKTNKKKKIWIFIDDIGACQASCRLLLYLCSNFSAQSPHDLRRVIGGPFSAMSKLC
jgi:hypothetical protein